MKVNGKQPTVLQDIKAGHRKEADSADKKNELNSANDSVKTSSFTMDKMKIRINAEPEVRFDRVAELKSQIKNGDYEVDSQKLAGKMLVESLRDDNV